MYFRVSFSLIKRVVFFLNILWIKMQICRFKSYRPPFLVRHFAVGGVTSSSRRKEIELLPNSRESHSRLVLACQTNFPPLCIARDVRFSSREWRASLLLRGRAREFLAPRRLERDLQQQPGVSTGCPKWTFIESLMFIKRPVALATSPRDKTLK